MALGNTQMYTNAGRERSTLQASKIAHRTKQTTDMVQVKNSANRLNNMGWWWVTKQLAAK